MQRINYLVLPLSFCLTAVAPAQTVKQQESGGVNPAKITKNTREIKALEIMKKVDSAIKKVTSVQYTAKREMSGPLAKRLSPAEGAVINTMASSDGLRKFRVSIRMKPLHSEEVLRFTVGCDGDMSYLIDPAKKYGLRRHRPGRGWQPWRRC